MKDNATWSPMTEVTWIYHNNEKRTSQELEHHANKDDKNNVGLHQEKHDRITFDLITATADATTTYYVATTRETIKSMSNEVIMNSNKRTLPQKEPLLQRPLKCRDNRPFREKGEREEIAETET